MCMVGMWIGFNGAAFDRVVVYVLDEFKDIILAISLTASLMSISCSSAVFVSSQDNEACLCLVEISVSNLYFHCAYIQEFSKYTFNVIKLVKKHL